VGLKPAVVNQDTVTKPVVYVLDDDYEVGVVVHRMLSALGYAAVAYTNADECVRRAETAPAREKPIAIVLDLALGKTDAVDVFDKLVASSFKGRVLLISGSDPATLAEIQAVGSSRGLMMLPALKKPFRIDDLKKSLGSASPAAAPPNGSPAVGKGKLPPGFVEREFIHQRLAVWYDIKVDAKSGRPCGAEAMLYAQHPAQGWTTVVGSLPPAEHSIHHPLARFALRQMTMDWGRHFAAFNSSFKLSAKLPLAVVTARGFVQFIRGLLPTDPNFSGLVMEISDWWQFNNEKAVREAHARLSLYRVGFSVDDIGVVYSSIAGARGFPFVELRLAPALLNEANSTVCRDAIELAHRAGASVCATAALNSKAFQDLRDMGCDTIQLGGPMPLDAFKQKIQSPEFRG
jgi:EAL domain-containing protein (putative c-di-GMP-specific phosphodiesterase class I)/CheY-like chemotaxis protein